jgi:hypothetical protein
MGSCRVFPVFMGRLQLIDFVCNLRYSERMEKKSSTAFIVGARPPQTLSPVARRQLSSAKPSTKAQKLAENAARAMSGGSGICIDDVATASVRTSKKSTRAK